MQHTWLYGAMHSECLFVYSGYACSVYSIHVASTEAMAFSIIISGSAIFSAGLRPFYMRHSRLSMVQLVYSKLLPVPTQGLWDSCLKINM